MPICCLHIPRSPPSNHPFPNRMPLAIRPYAKRHTIVWQGAYDLMARGISLAKHLFSSLKPPVSLAQTARFSPLNRPFHNLTSYDTQSLIVRYTVSCRTMHDLLSYDVRSGDCPFFIAGQILSLRQNNFRPLINYKRCNTATQPVFCQTNENFDIFRHIFLEKVWQ